MLFRLRRIYGNLEGSLWFIPSLVMASLMLLAFLMVWLDRTLGYANLKDLTFFFSAGPQGTRDMLTTIAGSMLAVASVAFSFTIVVFSYASSQYSSRTIHNFMDDRTNQAVLGTLLGSFVYCLLILRTVRLEDTNTFVPVLAASVALVLAILDLGLFILFIHHVSEAIQAYHIISRIGRATSSSIDSFFPRRFGTSAGITKEEAEKFMVDLASREVNASGNGYLQAIDTTYMLSLAQRYDLTIIQCKGVGQFVTDDDVLALMGPTEKITDHIRKQILECFFLGEYRSILQDPAYGILLLSDIMIKALSPGINDPNTALMGLNEINRVLKQLARKELHRHILNDKQGKPRVLVEWPSFEQLTAQAFDQVRRYGMADAAIPAKMLEVISDLGEVLEVQAEREVLFEHVRAIATDADQAIKNPRDRALINAMLIPAMQTLQVNGKDIRLL
ncbi:MAG: DUF2254 domain-containing protein [Chloroflexia bacterium]